MTRLSCLLVLGLLGVTFGACGPDAKPERPCDGPTFNLTVRAEPGPLPPDTRINVRYGGNHEGEPYVVGQTKPGQSVFCEEQADGGGSIAAGGESAVGGAPNEVSVQKLTCRLFTQGPASLDATASGYEPIAKQSLELDDKHRCQVEVEVVMIPILPDAGM